MRPNINLYQLIRKRYVISLLLILMIVISIYTYAIYWPEQKLDNVPIMAELEVLSIEPENSSLNSTIEIFFNDYTGQRIGNDICNCSYVLYQGDTQVIIVENGTQDYFSILLTMSGTWNNAVVNLRINGTDKGIEPFVIRANNSPISYNMPNDLSNRRYFRIYKKKYG